MAGPIFLDRDGVINYNREDYVKTPEEFVFLPGSAAAAARLSRAGRAIFIVSNQAGVGKGLLTDVDLERITQKMLAGLRVAGASIQGVYYCTHLPNAGCDCRKPRPGMMQRAAREHGLNLEECIIVGDDPRDVAAGAAVGARTVLVLSGKTPADCGLRIADCGLKRRATVPNPQSAIRNPQSEERCRPTHVAADLAAAVDWILEVAG